MKVYIAGPMRNIPNLNFPAFNAAAKLLREQGYEVINPAEEDIKAGYSSINQRPFKECASEDVALVLSCDAIALLPGWQKSRGARLEVCAALAADTPLAILDATTGKPLMLKSALDVIPSGEVRVTDPRTGGQKGSKLARFSLLPWMCLWEIAEHYGKGASKYSDRNWERGYSWSLSFSALQRHLAAWWEGEEIDAETGSSHLAAAAFHVLALMYFSKHHKALDDRPHVITAQDKSAVA